MKSVFYLAIAALFLGACSSSPAVNENVSVRSNVDISELNNPNQNSIVQANTNPNGLTDIATNKPINVEKKEAGKNTPPIDAKAKPLTRLAPDDSEFQSMMNSKGQPMEIRVFKSHPVLAKVERTYADLQNPQVKVYLKNGKTIDLPAGQINDPMQAPAEEIVGVLNGGNAAPAPTKSREL